MRWIAVLLYMTDFWQIGEDEVLQSSKSRISFSKFLFEDGKNRAVFSFSPFRSLHRNAEKHEIESDKEPKGRESIGAEWETEEESAKVNDVEKEEEEEEELDDSDEERDSEDEELEEEQSCKLTTEELYNLESSLSFVSEKGPMLSAFRHVAIPSPSLKKALAVFQTIWTMGLDGVAESAFLNVSKDNCSGLHFILYVYVGFCCRYLLDYTI